MPENNLELSFMGSYTPTNGTPVVLNSTGSYIPTTITANLLFWGTSAEPCDNSTLIYQVN